MTTIADCTARGQGYVSDPNDPNNTQCVGSSMMLSPAVKTWATIFYVVDTASMAACAYHGYKRNNSIGWAIGWAFMGAMFPVIAPVIAVAQGFGKPIGARANRRRRRHGRRGGR